MNLTFANKPVAKPASGQLWLEQFQKDFSESGRPTFRVSVDRASIIQRVRSLDLDVLEPGDIEPNERCRRNAEDIIVGLWNDDGMRPHTIGPVAEGGILVTYRADDAKFRLTLEIDNDGDVVGVISKGKKILKSEDVTPPAEWSDIVRDFQSRISSSARMSGTETN